MSLKRKDQMKNLIQAAVVTLFAASTAQAQQVVQWKLSDGGNGHWYRFVSGPVGCFAWWQANAESSGAFLASIGSVSEQTFLGGLLPGATGGFVGGTRSPESDVNSGWTWVTGEPFSPTAVSWAPDNPGCCAPNEFWLRLLNNGLHDGAECENGTAAFFEWSADCNSDGFVDYGQCHEGTLPDYNSNNIPDCCERGEACVVGNYPVQWRGEDGGNGHWYSGIDLGHPVFWIEARDMASASGGHLATPSTAGEDHFLVTTFLATARLYRPDYSCCEGPYIGAFNEGAGWKWVDGTPWSYTNWHPGNPNEIPFTVVVYWSRPECQWQDQNDIYPQYKATAYIVEWSADCNNDNIVDYGQILQGQLGDANTDGIPDICKQSTCRDADLFRDLNVNGADLGILLSQWGPNAQFTVSDINKDGSVNGADLGLLLSFWGACP